MILYKHPVSWYVDKLERKEPFTSLLWGDGEFQVATRRKTGKYMQNGELVTTQLEDEVRSALVEAPNVYHGTDPSIAQPWTYGGRDISSVEEMHRCMLAVAVHVKEWYDGTVWDTAAQQGELGPLIKVLSGRETMLVANKAMQTAIPFRTLGGAVVPDRDAASSLDRIAAGMTVAEGAVVVVCCGVSAIPLILRLRRQQPRATYLDLGSTFDVFAKIGAERGWRSELYSDQDKYNALITKHMQRL